METVSARTCQADGSFCVYMGVYAFMWMEEAEIDVIFSGEKASPYE